MDATPSLSTREPVSPSFFPERPLIPLIQKVALPFFLAIASFSISTHIEDQSFEYLLISAGFAGGFLGIAGLAHEYLLPRDPSVEEPLLNPADTPPL